jgi:hypothetical protein
MNVMNNAGTTSPTMIAQYWLMGGSSPCLFFSSYPHISLVVAPAKQREILVLSHIFEQTELLGSRHCTVLDGVA